MLELIDIIHRCKLKKKSENGASTDLSVLESKNSNNHLTGELVT